MTDTNAVNSNFSIIGSNTSDPKLFWKGKQLSGIQKAVITIDDDGGSVQLKVDPAVMGEPHYVEMAGTGIDIKKGKTN